MSVENFYKALLMSWRATFFNSSFCFLFLVVFFSMFSWFDCLFFSFLLLFVFFVIFALFLIFFAFFYFYWFRPVIFFFPFINFFCYWPFFLLLFFLFNLFFFFFLQSRIFSCGPIQFVFSNRSVVPPGVDLLVFPERMASLMLALCSSSCQWRRNNLMSIERHCLRQRSILKELWKRELKLWQVIYLEMSLPVLIFNDFFFYYFMRSFINNFLKCFVVMANSI